MLLDSTSLVVARGANVIGETLTIDGNVFIMVDSAIVANPSDTEIAVAADASTFDVANAIVDKINSSALLNGTAVASENTVNTDLPISGSSALAFLAVNSTDVISGLAVDYTSAEDTATLRYTPVANGFGIATVRLTVRDAGVDGQFGVAQDARTLLDEVFTITIGALNDAPTLDQIPGQLIDEDAGQQTVSLSGIGTGETTEVEDLRVSAVVEQSSVLIVGSGANVADQVITVDGVDFRYVTVDNGENDEIVIRDTNNAVTVDSTYEVAQATAAAINAHPNFGPGTAVAFANTVNSLRSITTTSDELLAVSSSDVVGNVTTNYTSPDSTGSVSYTPLDNAFGMTWITVTVEDAGIDGVFGGISDGSVSRTFPVRINPVNDQPSLNELEDLFITVNAGEQTVDLTGILRGPANELHDLRITVVSSDPTVIPAPSVDYVTPNALGRLTFTPVADQAGAATITVTLEDAGVDGVFGDALTAASEQADNLRILRSFRVSTNPLIISPVGDVDTGLPQFSWTEIPGSSAYEVELRNVTDDVLVDLNPNDVGINTFLTSETSLQLPQSLALGEYQLNVTAIDAFGIRGLPSNNGTFFVRTPPTITNPTQEQVEDSTPTFTWNAVPGADSYGIAIINATTDEQVFAQQDITGTSVTVPNVLPLGNYRYVVSANNEPVASSSGLTVSASTEGTMRIATAPEIILPAVAIYDTTPTITWTALPGAVVNDLQIINLATNEVVLLEESIMGSEFTVQTPLPEGDYQAILRSFADEARTIPSAFSTPHVFQVGSAPVLFGPSDNTGATNLRRTADPNPTLTWQGSLDGETYQIWLSNLTTGEAVAVVDGLESASYTHSEQLSVGRYRYWVRAQTGVGERSAWSRSQDFDVVTPPTIDPINPAILERRPTITWEAQENVQAWQIWINDIDQTPAQIVHNVTGLTTNEFTVPEDLEIGRYRVWVRGVEERTTGDGTVYEPLTLWSAGVTFEIGGRPTLTIPRETDDPTPTLTWQEVPGASSYHVYFSPLGAVGSPIVNERNIGTNFYTIEDDVPTGNYQLWVRAFAPDGTASPWSLTSQSHISVITIETPILNDTPDGTDTTPTISWSASGNAETYEVYISERDTPAVAVVRQAGLTTTSYTTRVLAAGEYRVWVRAVSAEGDLSRWSLFDDFTIVSNDDSERDAEDIVMLTSLDFSDSQFIADDVTITPKTDFTEEVDFADFDLPPEIVALAPDANTTLKAEVEEVDSDAATMSDELMSQWDETIRAEEAAASAPTAVAEPVETRSEQKTASLGWLAGLAGLAPSLFKRRRREQD